MQKIGEIGKTIIFILMFMVLFYFISETLKFKYGDGVRPMENYYALPEDTVDVLFMGDSHVGMNVDPSTLWQEQGIASYICWAGTQPVWNTYYYLRECMKTQNPKLVVMDVHMATNDVVYADYEAMVKTIVGMRWSQNKIDAIKVSASPEYLTDVFLEFPTYHYRYSDLTTEDFSYYFWQKDTSIQGGPFSQNEVPINITDPSLITECEKLADKEDDYLHRIIAYCKEQNVPLLLIASPYDANELELRRYNEIKKIAEENGLDFLYFNEFYEDLGINTENSFIDLGHLNENGIKKYSTYLAEYLKCHYDLPDRREDSSHIWNQNVNINDNCIYSLDEQFQGGGLNYKDTGVVLYDNPYASYTLFTQIDTRSDSDEMVYLSCFCEEENNFRGLLIRKESNGNFYIIFNAVSRLWLTEYEDELTLAVVKNGLKYQVYADGVLLGEITLNSMERYDGTLLLGAEMGSDGKLMRHSDVRVKDLKIYDVALDETAISQWVPGKLPEPAAYQPPAAGSKADYELDYRFEGDGIESYIDTGICLYDEMDKSWTVLAQFEEGDAQGSGVYFSCFAEDETNYRGLIARRTQPGNVNIMYGNYNLDVEVEEHSVVTIAVVKNQYTYSVYVNGEKMVDGEMLPVDEYPGHLLIGAQETTEGEKIRFGEVMIYNFEYYDGIMEDVDIRNWKPEFKDAVEKPEGSPVEYIMEQSFLGDGTGEYRDTGIQLYDVADKDWTLTVRFRKEKDSLGMLASCFEEIPGKYRGLLINLIDTSTLSLTLGQTAETIDLPPAPVQTLKIVKKGYEYTVYMNDEIIIDSIESRAPAYEGNLYIGCQVDGNGTPFRFSTVQIQEFRVTGEGE